MELISQCPVLSVKGCPCKGGEDNQARVERKKINSPGKGLGPEVLQMNGGLVKSKLAWRLTESTRMQAGIVALIAWFCGACYSIHRACRRGLGKQTLVVLLFLIQDQDKGSVNIPTLPSFLVWETLLFHSSRRQVAVWTGSAQMGFPPSYYAGR